MSDIKNILTQIKSLAGTVDVFIPSLNQTVKVQQLSVKQCKDLINMPQNILHAQYAFFRKFYNILKENASEYADQFNIVDRVPLCITLRSKSLDKYQDIKLSSDILPLIPTIKYDLVAPTVTTENYIFETKIPTLKSEDIFNKFVMTNYKLSTDVNIEEMQQLSQEAFGELAVIEICKYISHITIRKEDIDIDMESLSPMQRKEIVENIQLDELRDVIDFNNKVHTVEAMYTNYTIDGKEQSVQLEIGPDFFIFI